MIVKLKIGYIVLFMTVTTETLQMYLSLRRDWKLYSNPQPYDRYLARRWPMVTFDQNGRAHTCGSAFEFPSSTKVLGSEVHSNNPP